MNIESPNGLAIAASQSFSLTPEDTGGAAVAIKIEIWQGETRLKQIFYANTQNTSAKGVQLPPGAYEMFVTIAATRKKNVLNAKYNSTVMLTDNGVDKELSIAKGAVPASKQTDLDAEVYDLTVAVGGP